MIISFGAFALCWAVFGVWWISNTYFTNSSYTRPLQKIMCFVVLFKLLNEVFIACSLASSSSLAKTYWGLAYTSTFTLYNTFVYTSLILISKGFCITRDLLERSEVTVVAMTMGGVYLGFSAYMMNPAQLFILPLVMLSVLFYLVVHYTLGCLRALTSRYQGLLNSDIEAMLEPVNAKIKLFKNFLSAVCFFFLSQLLVTCVLQAEVAFLVPSMPSAYYIAVNLGEEFCETAALIVIFVLFRSKYHGLFATLQQIGTGMQVQPVAPLINAQVPEGYPLDLWRIPNDIPVVVYPPQDFNSEYPYQNLLIATRITS